MRTIMRLLIGLVGLFNIAVGLGFLVYPAKLGAAFFLTPVGSQGLATLRADFPGFFIGASIFALIGAWRAQATPLFVPIVMLGLAIFGRFVSLAIDGVGPEAIPPMIVEAIMLTLLLTGVRVFGRASR